VCALLFLLILHKRTNLNHIKGIILGLSYCLFILSTQAQEKIGLVLSGGGASGLAHIGVLKALEEQGIPIDYITGTSAGALVGAMYCSGFSPSEIEAYVLSDAFQLMTKGKLEPKQEFLYRKEEENASMLSLILSKDSILYKSLPTNAIESAYLDFELFKLLGITGAQHYSNFDSLLVPFRCVASDIVQKESIMFKSGDLNAAVRASMTYPFYFNPIRVDGKLLFDGGLYNNFPADVMYNEFMPDILIGSNVSGNAAPPDEDNFLSQITNMLVSHTAYKLPCQHGIILEPNTQTSTFEFEAVKQAIEAGYVTTIKDIDAIKQLVTRRISAEEIQRKRSRFRNQKPVIIDSISTNKIKKNNLFFAKNSLLRMNRREQIDLKSLEKRYYRLYSSPQIEFIFPTIKKQNDSLYALNLNIRKVREFKLNAGGHFSSRSVNTGYIGIDYRNIGRIATNLHASSYFGKFYGSGKLQADVELSSKIPFTVSPYLILNRWDYFRSLATFFEDVKPSFLVQYEIYSGVKFKFPIGNTARSSFDYRSFYLENNYYQTNSFTNKDTADITSFGGNSISWDFEKNTKNRKQFASAGNYLKIKARYILGKETTIPGSTSSIKLIEENEHNWITLNAEFQTFFLNNQFFHLGIHTQGVFNSQSLFANYTSTLLMMNSYAPTPDVETYFLAEYRSPQHAGVGINVVFTPYKNIDLRVDGYFYQPFIVLLKDDLGLPKYSKPFKGETYIGSVSAIYHSPVGPIRATFNYFPKQTIPINFQISYGYVLFNERAIR
jgi:NTE family protein